MIRQDGYDGRGSKDITDSMKRGCFEMNRNYDAVDLYSIKQCGRSKLSRVSSGLRGGYCVAMRLFKQMHIYLPK